MQMENHNVQQFPKRRKFIKLYKACVIMHQQVKSSLAQSFQLIKVSKKHEKNFKQITSNVVLKKLIGKKEIGIWKKYYKVRYFSED